MIKINNIKRKMSFTSQGGVIYSTDDWYLLDNKLAITQTTIGPADASVYGK